MSDESSRAGSAAVAHAWYGDDVIINAGDKEFVEFREIIPQLH